MSSYFRLPEKEMTLSITNEISKAVREHVYLRNNDWIKIRVIYLHTLCKGAHPITSLLLSNAKKCNHHASA